MDDAPRRGPGRPPKPREDGTVKVRIKRGYFRGFGPKCVPGDMIDVDATEAAYIVSKGIGERL
jgi:hypothetical protein